MKANFKGKAYASNSGYYKQGPASNGVESEDDATSDFKTTALRFTNNNFVADSRQRMERDASNGSQKVQGSLLNTLSNPLNFNNQNQVPRPTGLKFGTGEYNFSKGPPIKSGEFKGKQTI